MNLYAESSAVLAWLLDEPTEPSVRRLLGEAEMIVAPDLTLIERDRGLAAGAGVSMNVYAKLRKGLGVAVVPA